ncbi:ABC transporter ATP-binding protein [Thiopseudomonas alkaliphila]|uniref:ABC transporter ATP-binding protein n=1 Tax=Thiopseudomonas alkaliphila TaxID=1697053 RepID=A0A0K1XBS3_9GAMM|nr:ABC transporter ATP-binding protein [Thiopseudomonas alkaliphila]AKX58840.1 ABC transporter ATP-binding protein [Thiopseudomonas alkaliphila]
MPKTLPILQLSDISKSFNQGILLKPVLSQINLTLMPGELVALIGQSGSGKSTLLNIMGLLDQASSGELYIQQHSVNGLSDAEKTQLRNQLIGFVFQFHHLLSAFSVLDNVLLPVMLRQGKPKPAHLEYAKQLLAEVGLGDVLQRSALQLSGGQQQRVAIARALINRPKLLLADEPTGNLDSETSAEVFALFKRLNQTLDCSIVVVTHDLSIAQQCPRTVQLKDGQVIYDGDSLGLTS